MSWRDVPAYWERRIQRLKKWRAVAIQKEREREEVEREASENEERQEVIAALAAINRKAQRKTERNQAKLLAPKWWQDRRFLLDVTGVVIAAGVGWVFWRQQNIMQGQLEEMREQRLMTITQLRANMAHVINASSLVESDGSTAWLITPIWHNSGGTEARGFTGWDCIVAVTAADAARLDFSRRAKQCRGGKMIPVPVSPGGEIVQESVAFPVQTINAAMNGSVTIYAWGHIEYRDIFPNSPLHHANWCVKAIPQQNGKSLFFYFPFFSPSCVQSD